MTSQAWSPFPPLNIVPVTSHIDRTMSMASSKTKNMWRKCRPWNASLERVVMPLATWSSASDMNGDASPWKSHGSPARRRCVRTSRQRTSRTWIAVGAVVMTAESSVRVSYHQEMRAAASQDLPLLWDGFSPNR